jgi:hypothetical protein
MAGRKVRHARLRPANFSRAGEEDQHVSRRDSGSEAFESGQHLFLERTRVGFFEKTDLDGEETPFGSEHRAVAEEGRERACFESG